MKSCDSLFHQTSRQNVSSNVPSKVFRGPMGCIMILLLETKMISQITGYQVHNKWKNNCLASMNVTHFERKTEVLWYSSESSGSTVKSNNCRMLRFTTSPWVFHAKVGEYILRLYWQSILVLSSSLFLLPAVIMKVFLFIFSKQKYVSNVDSNLCVIVAICNSF